MAFQVMTDAVERAVEVGRVRVEFHVSNLVEGAATERVQTETGSMVVSTPETTAFDLIRFPSSCGYWNNIATVLSELAEKLDPEKLATGAKRVARSDVHRLGWLLDLVEESTLADVLAKTLEGERLLPTPLTNARDNAGRPPRPSMAGPGQRRSGARSVIPKAAITAWRKTAPWGEDWQVEQDLILSRALIDMFSQPTVAELAVFRGGTALHKPPPNGTRPRTDG